MRISKLAIAVLLIELLGSATLPSMAKPAPLRAPRDMVFPGETLVYEVRWDPPGWMFFLPTISAGEMTLRFQDQISYKGKPAYKITADAVSSGFLPKITGITVKDYFESIVDASEFCSFRMTKKTREGNRLRDIFLTFDRENGRGHFLAYDMSKTPPVELRNEEVENVPRCVQDLLSAIYHTRLRELEVGGNYPLTVSDNGLVKEIQVKVTKRETVSTGAGSFRALKIETISVFGGLLRQGGTFVVWLADDGSRTPVRFEAKVKLGKVFGTIQKIGKVTAVTRR